MTRYDPKRPLCYFCEPALAAISRALELSEQETELVRCFVAGMNDKKVARLLNISVHSVRNGYRRLCCKAGARGRSQLALKLGDVHLDCLGQQDPPLGCTKSAIPRVPPAR